MISTFLILSCGSTLTILIEISNIQTAVDTLARCSRKDKFQLNESKCKELRISFSTKNTAFDPVVINDKPIEIVSNAKILGLISKDLMELSHK